MKEEADNIPANARKKIQQQKAAVSEKALCEQAYLEKNKHVDRNMDDAEV
jgi:hypothetical protein